MEKQLLSENTQREITRALSRVVAQFEIFGRDIVSVRDVAQELGIPATSPRVARAIRALVRRGWLRPLPVRGTYEFLPARRGPYASGDPLTEARAVRERRPDFRLALVGTGAAFLRAHSERAPDEYTVAIDRAQGGSGALVKAYRVIKTTEARLAGIPYLRDVPVSDAAHLLADAAMWPSASGDLRNREHWLRRALTEVTGPDAVRAAGRAGLAGTARMAFIANRFGASDLAEALVDSMDGRRAKTWIGSKGRPVVAHDPRLGVDDHLGVATLG